MSFLLHTPEDPIAFNNKGNFKIPTIIQVKEYCTERKNNVDAETFCDFYESKGWQIGKEIMKSWKACVRTWEKKEKANAKHQRSGKSSAAWTTYNIDNF